MIANINSVEDFNSNNQLASLLKSQSESLTEKGLVKQSFERGFTIRLGAVKDILVEIKGEKA